MPDDTTLPDPLVPLEVDLRGLEWMPYYGDRLGRSEFNARADDATWRAGHNLWWAAWNNVPAASLPNDDVALTRFADLGRDVKAFRRLKEEALHGFILCNDGRLYHPFLSEQAKIAWGRRVKDREKKRRWREGKNSYGDDPGTGPGTGTRPGRDGSRHGPGTDDRTGQDRTGQDRDSVDGYRKESIKPNKESSKTARAPFSEYGFVGQVIRLTNKDLDLWKQTYHAIPDIIAELSTLDSYYSSELSEEERRRWFIRCSAALDKKHQAAIAIEKKKNGGLLPNEGVF